MAGATTALDYKRDLKWVRTHLYGDYRLKAMQMEGSKLFYRCKLLDANGDGKLQRAEVSRYHDWHYTKRHYNELVRYLKMFSTPWRHPLRTPTAPRRTIEQLRLLLSPAVIDRTSLNNLAAIDASIAVAGGSLLILKNKGANASPVYAKIYRVPIKRVIVKVQRSAKGKGGNYVFKVELTNGTKITERFAHN